MVSLGGVGGRALSKKRFVKELADRRLSTLFLGDGWPLRFFQCGREKRWVVVSVVVVVTTSVRVVVVWVAA